jgi:epoxyqueuosine reductase QueG
MLIQRGKGSYFFLSVLLTDAPLQTPPLREVPFSCGTCTACLDACPTQALTPGVLDSRRCLSYLTLEQPHPLSPQEGSFGWLAGCDICQEVCPWNRKPSNAIHHALIPHERFAKPQKGPHPPQEGWYAYWTDHTPLKRIPQERLATNWQTLDTMTPVQASHPSHRSEPIEGVDPDDHPPNHTL